MVGDVPYQCGQSREPVRAPVRPGIGMEQVVGAGVGDGLVGQAERILQVLENLGLGLGLIGAAEIATCGRLFARDLLGPSSLAHATCFTCSANERTPLNSPWVGLKDHLSSGMASAIAVKSCSMLFQIKLIESGMFFGSAGRCCAVPETGFISSPAAVNTIRRFFMAFSISLVMGTRYV